LKTPEEREAEGDCAGFGDVLKKVEVFCREMTGEA